MRIVTLTVTTVLGLAIASFFTTLSPSPTRLVYERDPISSAKEYCPVEYLSRYPAVTVPAGTVDIEP